MTMRVYQYDPWTIMNRFSREFGRLAEAQDSDEATSNVVTSDWAPAVDIQEKEDRYVLFADVPGVDPAQIEVNMENGCLSIRGERSPNGEDRRDYKRIERPRGAFYRRFSMPDTADASRITARFDKGVLEITIPKHEKLQPRRIAIEQ
jgi:HSP20 family protein